MTFAGEYEALIKEALEVFYSGHPFGKGRGRQPEAIEGDKENHQAEAKPEGQPGAHCNRTERHKYYAGNKRIFFLNRLRTLIFLSTV